MRRDHAEGVNQSQGVHVAVLGDAVSIPDDADKPELDGAAVCSHDELEHLNAMTTIFGDDHKR